MLHCGVPNWLKPSISWADCCLCLSPMDCRSGSENWGCLHSCCRHYARRRFYLRRHDHHPCRHLFLLPSCSPSPMPELNLFLMNRLARMPISSRHMGIDAPKSRCAAGRCLAMPIPRPPSNVRIPPTPPRWTRRRRSAPSSETDRWPGRNAGGSLTPPSLVSGPDTTAIIRRRAAGTGIAERMASATTLLAVRLGFGDAIPLQLKKSARPAPPQSPEILLP